MMNNKVKHFKVRSSVRDVLQVLRNCTHNAFPVVDSDARLNSDGTMTFGRMRGLMKRHDIVRIFLFL